MIHEKHCRFANDNQIRFKSGKCFDCERIVKVRNETREEIAQEITIMSNDEVAHEVDPWQVFLKTRNKAIAIARGQI